MPEVEYSSGANRVYLRIGQETHEVIERCLARCRDPPVRDLVAETLRVPYVHVFDRLSKKDQISWLSLTKAMNEKP